MTDNEIYSELLSSPKIPEEPKLLFQNLGTMMNIKIISRCGIAGFSPNSNIKYGSIKPMTKKPFYSNSPKKLKEINSIKQTIDKHQSAMSDTKHLSYNLI